METVIDHSGEQKIGINNEILYDNNTINHEQEKLIKKTDEIKYFFESNENNFWPLKPKLNIDYVCLQMNKKERLSKMDHQYLIERVHQNE